jgi:hypothetical protein
MELWGQSGKFQGGYRPTLLFLPLKLYGMLYHNGYPRADEPQA